MVAAIIFHFIHILCVYRETYASFVLAIFLQVFQRERLNGHYGVATFVMANTFSSTPYLFMISFVAGTISYYMAGLHPGLHHYMFFVLTLFASVACVESIMMAIASVVPNYLMGIITGAGILVCLR